MTITNDISSVNTSEIVTAEEIDKATDALVDEFVEEDALTELELINQRIIEENDIVEIIVSEIGLNEQQSIRLARICRDRNVEPQDLLAAILGSFLENNVGAPVISRPNLRSQEVETQQEVIAKVTGVSTERQIYSIVDGQVRR